MHVCASQTTALRIEFDSQADFQDEYVRNLSIGGVFVETSEPWEVQTPVCIQLALVWCGEQLRLDGEVVHCLTPEMAAAGGTPGVAVQLNALPDDLREQFSPYLNQVEPNEKKAGIGRRVSQRAQARVIARVMEDGKTKAEYRTRDISTTGALLADEGRPLPVGTSLDLAFEHPVTGEILEVAGLVVRHVQSDSGGISGMGVQFVIPDARQAEVSEFLSDVRATEHSRQLTGVCGKVGDLGPEATLRKFAAVMDEGTLVLKHGGEEGFVGFRKGRFTGARLGRSAGLVALRKLLAWRDGEFEMLARLDDPTLDDVSLELDTVIVRASAENERLAKAEASSKQAPVRREADLAQSIQPDRKFAVMHERIDADTTDLDKTEEAVLDLAAVGMTVARMLEVIPEHEFVVTDAIDGLIERGFIEMS
jgi:Tfp pilus assembly protein PilZ